MTKNVRLYKFSRLNLSAPPFIFQNLFFSVPTLRVLQKSYKFHVLYSVEVTLLQDKVFLKHSSIGDGPLMPLIDLVLNVIDLIYYLQKFAFGFFVFGFNNSHVNITCSKEYQMD